jgi:lipopolysaccharide export LptBFGC system permease protein LptF
LELKFETKLLKVKNPQFFSLRELFNLLTLSKYAGLNYYPYLWELVKRLLLVLFSAMVPVVAFIRLFSSTDNEEFLSQIGFLSFAFVSFYVALIFFQNAVGKVSLNPLYGFLLLLPYLFLFYRTLKGD